MNPYRLRAYLLLLVASFIWGVAGVVIKYTLGGFPPLVFLSYRFTLATIASVFIYLLVRHPIPKDKTVIKYSLLYGFLTSTVALGLLFFGVKETTAIDANLISAVAPITIAVSGYFFLREHITLREKIGISIAFLGTGITIVGPAINSGVSFSGLAGNLLVFASVLVGALTAVLAKVLLRKHLHPLFATNVSFAVGLVTILPVTLAFYSPVEIKTMLLSTPLSYHLGVVYMAVISGSFAYTLWHMAEKTIEVGEVGVFAYLYPVFGTPLAIIWLGEKITNHFIIGAAVIALGVIIAELKQKRQS